MRNQIVVLAILLISSFSFAQAKLENLEKLENLAQKMEEIVRSKDSLKEKLGKIHSLRTAAAEAYINLSKEADMTSKDFNAGADIYERMIAIFEVRQNKINKKIDQMSCGSARAIALTENQALEEEETSAVSLNAKKTVELINILCGS